ncbi:hypothetical protein LTR53_016215 [Teratosphaeriaceae sp. CCFEE 6253]|nr:hypothetical protein LTR53_016215 [Teratosphaeriaceae sp. CCFEE 6253]
MQDGRPSLPGLYKKSPPICADHPGKKPPHMSSTHPPSVPASPPPPLPPPPPPTPPTNPATHLLLAHLLQLLLRNGIAGALRLPRPCTLATCHALRARLLRDPFFDPAHRAHELAPPPGPRLRRSKILFADLVVLMARVLRVLMLPQPPPQPQQHDEDVAGVEGLTEAQGRERVAVRQEALGQPFFDRGVRGPGNPFAEPGVEDEGCWV